MDFGWPNVKIGQKMANGRLLFLALGIHNCMIGLIAIALNI